MGMSRSATGQGGLVGLKSDPHEVSYVGIMNLWFWPQPDMQDSRRHRVRSELLQIGFHPDVQGLFQEGKTLGSIADEVPSPDDAMIAALGQGGLISDIETARFEPLVGGVSQQPCQVLMRPGVHYFVGGQAVVAVHSHIEWGVVAIAEATFTVVELRRTHAKVEQHASHRAVGLT